MKILLSGAIVLALWMGAGTYWYTCQIKGLCGDAPTNLALKDQVATHPDVPPEPDKSSLSPWRIMEGNQTVFTFNGQPNLLKNVADVSIPPASAGVTDSIYQYLLRNPEKYVTITGRYNSGERYDGPFANLGEARAARLRDMLVNAGANPDRIKIVGMMNEANTNDELNFNADGKLHGGGAMGVNFATMTEEVAHEVDEGITNMTLYADFGETKFQADPRLKTYASDLKAYLAKHSGVTVHITGHTDNVGSAATNRTYGKRRAQKVQQYFVSTGIKSSSMTVDSKGMDAPVASNDTEEGRALNRRIEIKIN